MGNCGGGGEALTPEEKQAKQRSRDIEKLLKEDKKRLDTEVKLLLLGSGESGKTTISKQMKILYTNGFSNEERQAFVPIIHSNIILSMRMLVMNAAKLSIAVNDDDSVKFFTSPDILFEQELDDETVEAVEALWKNEGIQAAFEKRALFQLVDSCAYFFERVRTFLPEDYVPTDVDILMARSRTVGCSEISFVVDDYHFRLVDVGGQQSERRKWIHQFGDVRAVLFVTSLSEYDQRLMEDEKTNRMHDSLQLFEGISKSSWFKETPIILFLNKVDLFDEKVKRQDLKICFPEYTGGCEKEPALNFIRDKFVERAQDSSNMYIHITCATNTKNVEVVFNAVRSECLKEMLNELNVI